MSKVRPYLVTVGAQEYMIRATNQGQAINVAVKAHPMPVANAVAASADEVASWALAGKPIQTKDDFAPILPPTLVMQVMPDGKLASFCDGFRLEPGNYFLTLEPFLPEAAPATDPDAATGSGDDALPGTASEWKDGLPDALQGLQAQGEEPSVVLGEQRTDGRPTVVMEYDDAAGTGPVFPAAEPEAPMVDDGSVDETGPLPAAHEIKEPRFHGAFDGDTYRGDLDNHDVETHVWRDKAWHRIPLS